MFTPTTPLTTDEPPKLISVIEAARLMGVGRSTVDLMANRGEILKIKVGRRSLIPRAEIDRIAAGR